MLFNAEFGVSSCPRAGFFQELKKLLAYRLGLVPVLTVLVKLLLKVFSPALHIDHNGSHVRYDFCLPARRHQTQGQTHYTLPSASCSVHRLNRFEEGRILSGGSRLSDQDDAWKSKFVLPWSLH